MATGLEADKVEVLLLELLYKTDYGNDFDREVRVPRSPLLLPGPSGPSGDRACACMCVPVCACLCAHMQTCAHECVYMCVYMHAHVHVCACARVHA